MSRTASFRRQHEDLLGHINEIATLLSNTSGNAGVIRDKLSVFSGKLSVHLSMEDKALYPAMLAAKDAKTQQTAKEFMTEMGGLSDAFKAFNQKWITVDSISKNVDGFNTEIKALVQTVQNRIKREESNLYNLADAM